MLKYSQTMLDAMQYTANWMPGPIEGGDDPADMQSYMKASAVPVRFR